MNTPKSNPFTELDLDVNRKAVFQPFSHEAQKFDIEKSLDLLIYFVIKGYNLHSIVLKYLEDKGSLDDIGRISEIENAFIIYRLKISLQNKNQLKWCSISKMKDIIDNYNLCLLKNGNAQLSNQGDLLHYVKCMTEQIEGFVKAARMKNYPDSLSIRSLIISFVEDDMKTYKYLSKLWQIDLEEDLTEKIQHREKDNEHGHWNQNSLYSFVKDRLLKSLKLNHVPIYLIPVYEIPATQINNVLLKKFYPTEDHERIKTDEKFRHERMLDYAEKVIEILWLNKPLFDEPVYFVRNNYPLNDIANQYIPELFERNLISICIKDDVIEQENDMKLYNDLLQGKNVKFNSKLNYIHRFFDIVNQVKNRDIIVVSSYIGNFENKIGLVKKGTKIIELKKDGLTFFCLQMKSVYCTPYPGFWGETKIIKTLNLSDYPVLKSLIPQQVTISPVHKNKKKIYSIYYGYPLEIELASLSDESVEIMCSEWLRSEYAPKEFKIQFQLIRTGGNFADIDILGCNQNNEIVACQVTNTENQKLIKSKTDKLEKYNSTKKIMFSHLETLWNSQESYNQNITEVWNNFRNDNVYIQLLKKLIEN